MDTHACYNNGWIILVTAERSCLSGIRRMLHYKEKCYNKRFALLKVSFIRVIFLPCTDTFDYPTFISTGEFYITL